jgi:hypothetical protein
MKIANIEWKTTGSTMEDWKKEFNCPICDMAWLRETYDDIYGQDCSHKLFSWNERDGLKLGGYTEGEKAMRLTAWDKSALDKLLKDTSSSSQFLEKLKSAKVQGVGMVVVRPDEVIYGVKGKKRMKAKNNLEKAAGKAPTMPPTKGIDLREKARKGRIEKDW